jgi:hypothetical protein
MMGRGPGTSPGALPGFWEKILLTSSTVASNRVPEDQVSTIFKAAKNSVGAKTLTEGGDTGETKDSAAF